MGNGRNHVTSNMIKIISVIKFWKKLRLNSTKRCIVFVYDWKLCCIFFFQNCTWKCESNFSIIIFRFFNNNIEPNESDWFLSEVINSSLFIFIYLVFRFSKVVSMIIPYKHEHDLFIVRVSFGLILVFGPEYSVPIKNGKGFSEQ